MINFFILITKQLILYWYCKEKINIDKLAANMHIQNVEQNNIDS